MDGTLRVPTIALADWPDPFFHTDMDSIELADPTQMRRVITLAGSMGYYLSQLDPSDFPFVIANALSKARCRIARQLLRAIQTIHEATDNTLPDAYREALNFVEQSSRRECAALRSLTHVAHTRQQTELLDKGVDALAAEKHQALSELHAAALRKGAPLSPPPEDPPWAQWVPQRAPEIRGPINLGRPQYGQWWLFDRLGNLDFLNLALVGDGDYYPYETLNSVDGTRTVQEIRDLVSAEYDPVPLEHFYEYLCLLQKAGAIRWVAATDGSA